MNIGIIGAGHMGTGILKGFKNDGQINMKNIFIKSGNSSKAQKLAESIGSNVVYNYDDLTQCNLIILAVNKDAAESVLKEIGQTIDNATTLISIVASLPIKTIEQYLPQNTPVASLIPNTAVEVNKGVIGYSGNQYINNKQIEDTFVSLGKMINVPEQQLGILGTIAGCGPAFLDLFIEGLSDGAVLNGMSRDLSYEVILDMIIGSAHLALESQKHPGQLKDEVTSPGGSTIKGVSVLEKNNFRYALIESVNEIENK